MPRTRGVARDAATMRDFNKYLMTNVDVDMSDIMMASGAVGHALDEVDKMGKDLEKFIKEYQK